MNQDSKEIVPVHLMYFLMKRSLILSRTVDEYEPIRGDYDKFFYQTIFRLLYCTGMRIGEVLSLKPEDVDLANNVIAICNGKGNVSRFIPFTDSVAKLLQNYNDQRFNVMEDYFFESLKGGKRSKSAVNTCFKKIVHKAGISKRKVSESLSIRCAIPSLVTRLTR